MKDTFELIQWSFLDAPEIVIHPIYDVHLKSILCNEDEWKKFCAWLPKQKNHYIILGGDMINNNTRSSVGSPFEDTMRPREQKRVLAEQLEPIKHLILAAVMGNHEARSEKDADDDPMYDIMSKLDLEDYYRQDAAILKLSVGGITHGAARGVEPVNNYSIYVTHGAGGGIYTGATVNRNERFSYTLEGIDAVIVGHSHKGAITRPARMCVDVNHSLVTMRDVVVASMCSWQHFGGYAMRKMMLPSAEASMDNPQTLTLSGQQRKKNITVTW